MLPFSLLWQVKSPVSILTGVSSYLVGYPVLFVQTIDTICNDIFPSWRNSSDHFFPHSIEFMQANADKLLTFIRMYQKKTA